MRVPIGAGLLFMASLAVAEPAYVTDDLVLNVFADKGQQGAHVATLHSGIRVEVLQHEGQYTQVRLDNGSEGWVRSTFLTDREPAASKLKIMEQELARLKAAGSKPAALKSGSAPPDPALHAEVDSLNRKLEVKQLELDALKAAPAAPATAPQRGWVGPSIITGLLCLSAGFGWGYLTLARRIRARFGGVKVF